MDLIGSLRKRMSDNKAICEELSGEIQRYIENTDHEFSDTREYVDNTGLQRIKATGNDINDRAQRFSPGIFVSKKKLNKNKKILAEYISKLESKVNEHNNRVAFLRVKEAREILGKVEGRDLDDQQIQCIIKPNRNHLVIAGAGTGKTTTIVGKVKYLLATKQCDPKDILVLSFTNKSASEMRERIIKETGEQIEASTFHKLGMNIMTAVNGITPKISKIQLVSYVKEQLSKNMKESLYIKLLCTYFLFNHKYEKSEFDFTDDKEYAEYLRLNPPITLLGEQVKSYGEMDIANFLYQNDISYTYEREYEVDTRTDEKNQYYPDFYLDDYGIYIEYFGINEQGNVPDYFDHSVGKTASQEYREGMEWKRKIHKQNNTSLVECYAYERSKGELLPNLKNKLKVLGVKFNPKSPEEIWQNVSDGNNNLITGLTELMATIINLIKSNDQTLDEVRELCRMGSSMIKNTVILDLIEPIYNSYQEDLKSNDEIDFNDMINASARLVREGRYSNPYKYVIVDEYQDISKARYNLLKTLRDSSDYSLFCVGDDWQSIYRFTGSDMDYILNFAKYWGETEYSKIETTYRFTDSLIMISGGFVMQNPAQIRKGLRGTNPSKGFSLGEIKGYTEDLAIRFMMERLEDLPKNSSVFFIGRYNFDKSILDDYAGLECRYDNASEEIKVVYPKRSDLKMSFITAHRSKGLQADYVFIINNKDKGMGFPSKIQDDPIVDMLLQGKESYPYAEERRLFYVAMTRAKEKTFMVTINGNESAFATELETTYASQLKKERFTCPLCGGNLEKKSGPYGDFYGCSNYRTKGCKYTRKIKSS